jgi:hypothetical protein
MFYNPIRQQFSTFGQKKINFQKRMQMGRWQRGLVESMIHARRSRDRGMEKGAWFHMLVCGECVELKGRSIC